jgi:hypothetical protein
MSKRETRSPLKERPLRYPGQSLDDEITNIRDEILMFAELSVGYGVSLIVIWVDYLIRTNLIRFIMTGAALAILIITIYKFIRGQKNIELLQMARDGEKIVGEQLELLREKGYAIFHDIQAGNFNVDHVVISKHGIFAIETKTFSKPVKGDAKIYYDGEKINVNGWQPDRDPVKQAKANASWLKDILKQSTGNIYPVKGAVIFPGWYIESKTQKGEVWVLNPKALPVFIGNEPDVITQNDVNMISFHLSRYIRSPLSK